MKISIPAKILAAVLLLATFTENSRAQAVSEFFITTTAFIQNTSVTSGPVGNQTVIFAQPRRLAISQKSLLGYLALAKGMTFPTGSRIVNVNSDLTAAPTFQVFNKSNVLVVDVSDIMSATPSGVFGAQVQTGKTVAAEPSPSVATTQVFTFVYDDTGSPGGIGLQFCVSGPMTLTTTNGKTNALGHSVTQQWTLLTGSGDGKLAGKDLYTFGGVAMNSLVQIPPVP